MRSGAPRVRAGCRARAAGRGVALAALLLVSCRSEDLPVVEDLGGQRPPFRTLVADSPVLPGRPEYRDHLIAGWWPAEQDGERAWVWGSGPVSELDLALAAPRDPGSELILQGWPLCGEGGEPTGARVWLDDRDLGTVMLPCGISTAALPLSDRVEAGIHRVRLEFDRARRPCDVEPGNRDERPVTVALLRVEVSGGAVAGSPTPHSRATWDGARLRQDGGTCASRELPVPDDGRLATTVAAAEGNAGSVSARILAGDPAGRGPVRLLWQRSLRPGEHRDAVVDLSRYAGRSVRLDLAAEGDGVLSWDRPRLEGRTDRDLRTNVVLLDIDTLRADYLSAYGSLVPTPHLDRLARSGVEFGRAFSHAPITAVSHSSMFTSRYPDEHGVRNNTQILDDRFETLAGRLRDAWRVTGAAVSLGVLKARFGFGRGFDWFADSMGEDWWKPGGEVTDEVLPWLRDHRDGPFFLWVHYSDPHEPNPPAAGSVPDLEVWAGSRRIATLPADGRKRHLPMESAAGHSALELRPVPRTGRLFEIRAPEASGALAGCGPPPGWQVPAIPGPERWIGELPATVPLRWKGEGPGELAFRVVEHLDPALRRERYAAEVRRVDREVGRLVRAIESAGIADRTVVVMTSDHGETFGLRGRAGHVDYLYQATLHVPLLLVAPGRVPRGTLVMREARHVDIVPTVLDLLDLPPDPGQEGSSLLPLVAGEAASGRPAFGFTYRPEAMADRRSVVTGDWKAILEGDDVRELYDLRVDPGETRNLAGEAPEPALPTIELARRTGSPAATPSRAADLTADERERLEALGYVH